MSKIEELETKINRLRSFLFGFACGNNNQWLHDELVSRLSSLDKLIEEIKSERS